MKFRKTLPVVITSVMGLVWCLGEDYAQIRIYGQYRGFKTEACFEKEGIRGIALYDSASVLNSRNRLSATDTNNDGRFDEIRLRMDRGHELERLASLDSLEAIYTATMSQAQQ